MNILKKLQKIQLALNLAKEVKEVRFLQMQYAMLIDATPSQPGLFHAKQMKLEEVKEKTKVIDEILKKIEELENDNI